MILVIGWLLLALALYRVLASSSGSESGPTIREMAPAIAATEARALTPLQHRAEPQLPIGELIELSPGGVRAIEAGLAVQREERCLDEVDPRVTAESLLDVASGYADAEWRKRAGCYALAGLLLHGFHSATPFELELAGDALLIAADLYWENGASEDSRAAALRAVGAYERIPTEKLLADVFMRDAVRRKLAKAKAISSIDVDPGH